MSREKDYAYDIEDLIYLMRRLRDPNDGCPWDIQQDYSSIVPSTIEEAYEVADTIERGDLTSLQEELGDLLFQVVFYSQLAAEDKKFDLQDVVSDLVAKLVRRHPHVFPNGRLESRNDGNVSTDVINAKWESLKETERSAKGLKGVLDDVPVNFPALTRAQKIQKRASRIGFDWAELAPVIDKVEEELAEVKEAIEAQSASAIAEEMGDLMFACVNMARHLKVDAETVTRQATIKFETRFRFIEEHLAKTNKTWDQTSSEELNELWEKAKE